MDLDRERRRSGTWRTRSRAVVRRTVVLVLAGLLATTANGCSSGGSDHGSAPAPGRPATNPITRAVTAGCAWRVRADKATANLAYPDTSATYWATGYRLRAHERLVVSGRLPHARYSSFIDYDGSGDARTVRNDREIALPNGPYRVRFGGTTPGDGTLIYRVYLPRPATDPKGGTGLPRLSVVDAGGRVHAVPTCAHPGASATARVLVERNGPPTDRPAPATPIFLRPDNGGAGLYPNPDNVYVATIIHHVPGRIVVVRAKAPTFPDTRAGVLITGREQVRYWSVCTNEYRKPYPVTACVADQGVPLDAAGRFTIVISTPQDRPSAATRANGVAWLPWGPTTVDALVLVRHMLASPRFAESATRLAPGALAVSSMGAYAPIGTQCTRAVYDAEGPAGCR